MKRIGLIVLVLITLCTACTTSTVTPTATLAPTEVSTVAPTDAPTSTTEDLVRAQCRRILQEYGATIDGIYAYINNKDPLQRLYYNSADMPKGDIPEADELAFHLLETGNGVCYHFSALTYYLLTEAGYEAMLISGLRKTDNAPHRWTMVHTEDGWYHFDPQHRQKLLTDSQKQSATYLRGDAMYWEENIYPKTPN